MLRTRTTRWMLLTACAAALLLPAIAEAQLVVPPPTNRDFSAWAGLNTGYHANSAFWSDAGLVGSGSASSSGWSLQADYAIDGSPMSDPWVQGYNRSHAGFVQLFEVTQAGPMSIDVDIAGDFSLTANAAGPGLGAQVQVLRSDDVANGFFHGGGTMVLNETFSLDQIGQDGFNQTATLNFAPEAVGTRFWLMFSVSAGLDEYVLAYQDGSLAGQAAVQASFTQNDMVGVSAVAPEPASVSVLIGGAVLLLRKRR